MTIDIQIIGYVLNAMVALVGFFAVMTLKDIKVSIDRTQKSLEELNIKVATVIEKTSNHDKLLDSHSERIMHLEKSV